MLVAILACHNRRALTVRSLRALTVSAQRAGLPLKVVLFNDGSTDGTTEAAMHMGLDIEVLEGDGNQYWATSMALAERHALELMTETDRLLWLNDDTILDHDALSILNNLLSPALPTIAVGATVASSDGGVGTDIQTYGGLRFVGPHPLKYRLVGITGRAVPVDTFNGNIVLMTAKVARLLGGIDGQFSHAWADIDYGHRAVAHGVRVVQAAGVHGLCERGRLINAATLRQRVEEFRSRKGPGHPASLKRLLQRRRPHTWPIFYAWTYGAFAIRSIRVPLTRRRRGSLV